jgi:hypothetical protein
LKDGASGMLQSGLKTGELEIANGALPRADPDLDEHQRNTCLRRLTAEAGLLSTSRPGTFGIAEAALAIEN